MTFIEALIIGFGMIIGVAAGFALFLLGIWLYVKLDDWRTHRRWAREADRQKWLADYYSRPRRPGGSSPTPKLYVPEESP